MKLAGWFEIDDKEYVWYILQGYEISANEYRVKWHLGGKAHREDGPAIIYPDGTQMWCKHGRLHHIDGPAIIREDGSQSWYLNGLFHGTGCPAVINSTGGQAWYLNGKMLTEDEWRRQVGAELLV